MNADLAPGRPSYRPAVALTVAGSDSGGGAGIAADLRTFAALGVFGTVAVSAVTAQDTRAVHAVTPVSAAMLVAQIEAVATDLHPAALKTGMLATAENVDAVARLVREGVVPPPVVDPVLVSSTGQALLESDAVELYATALVPVAKLVTPNVAEASLLARMPITSVADMQDAARAIRSLGAAAVLVTGGHLSGEISTDVLVHDGGADLLTSPRVATANLHGSGCTLSAAIVALLATGRSLGDAVAGAKEFVFAAIAAAASWDLGSGQGPLDHFRWATHLHAAGPDAAGALPAAKPTAARGSAATSVGTRQMGARRIGP